ncbi:NADAR family protein [Paraflavitalea pollutisoli]|uniref:NADAR family protein n=1 Tax=Paraflavitalea pollutisoli TaxID=3034143 RepID=UPI0023ECCE4A|nr:NADAR family protein [Paraflavitalea sp. H1-2-19X]
MKYSLDILKQQIERGDQIEYLFFWGHTPKRTDVVDNSCLSQWFPAPFVVDGVTYSTAEHWMMAQKALLFGDDDAFHDILKADKPGTAKAIGRKVRNFDDELWHAKRYEVVVQGSYHKFSQHSAMRELLLRTGSRVIVEASPTDRIWGIGLSQNTWRGKNLLGFALMEARDQLRQ